MPRYDTANAILNSVAAQVGVAPVEDPYSSVSGTFAQLRTLLDVAGQELVVLPGTFWPDLVRSHEIVTVGTETDGFPLPDDYSYMIDQTGWDRASHLPMGGPLSSQDWTFLIGRGLASTTLYVSFRLMQKKFYVFPSPPPAGLTLTFEYSSRRWVEEAGTDPVVLRDSVSQGADIVLFAPVLIRAYLKAKFLEAKGMDSTKARDDFYIFFESISGKSKGAPVLSLTGQPKFPYLDMMSNVPDTNYGS